MVKRWHEQSARPGVIAARAPQRKQMPGLARQPAALIARRTAERVHHLGRRSAGAPKGKRPTHVPTPPPCDAPTDRGARWYDIFCPIPTRGAQKKPHRGAGPIVGLQVRQQTHHQLQAEPLVAVSEFRRIAGCAQPEERAPPYERG